MINKWSVCRSDVFLWIQSRFIRSYRTVLIKVSSEACRASESYFLVLYFYYMSKCSLWEKPWLLEPVAAVALWDVSLFLCVLLFIHLARSDLSGLVSNESKKIWVEVEGEAAAGCWCEGGCRRLTSCFFVGMNWFLAKLLSVVTVWTRLLWWYMWSISELKISAINLLN